MAEISAARCGPKKLLVDVTSSGMTHSWKHQSLASFRWPLAPLLTSTMRLAQALLPMEWQASDEATGRRLNALDLNFGELDFDFSRRRVAVRVFGVGGVLLERSFPLDALGVAGACEPLRGRLPAWRRRLAKALWVASVSALVLAPPVFLYIVMMRKMCF